MYKIDTMRKVREQRILHSATVELTYRCNLDCYFCYNDRDKIGIPLSLEQYQKLLQNLTSMQTLYLMLTGGEPMIHPHFFDIGKLAREMGFVTTIRTNGHSLNRKIAEKVKKEVDPYMIEVSLHGATGKVHDQQTNVSGSFDRLISNLEAAKTAGLRCSVVSTPTAWNEHQIDEMFQLCDRIGVPLRFQGPVAPRDNGDTEPLSITPGKETWDKVTRLVTERRKNVSPSSHARSGSDPAPTALTPSKATIKARRKSHVRCWRRRSRYRPLRQCPGLHASAGKCR